MKKLVITLSLLAGATVGYAQGIINWSDYQSASVATPFSPALPAFSISIFGSGSIPSGGEILGTGSYPNNTADDLPPGTAIYNIPPLSGTGYEVGLYVGTSPASVKEDVAAGAPVATDTFNSGFAGRWDVSEGLFAVTPFPGGTAVYVALAAWADNGEVGAVNSYSAAIGAGYGAAYSGVSTGTIVLGGGGSPPAIPGTLAGSGLESFGIFLVPEPSTFILSAIGASASLMRLGCKFSGGTRRASH